MEYVDPAAQGRHDFLSNRYESQNRMSLTAFRTLGRSGLVVSPLALGTMTFGPGAWGADEATSREIFHAYRAAGGNFIDTADIYSGGESERLVGQFIKETGARDDVVLATKFAFNGSTSPLTATPGGGGNPNAGGAGAKNIHRALDASLKRLGTDYVDLYWMHIWDGVTPVEEIVQTLGDLVRAGKIRYYGLSDMPAWLAMKAATIAAERRVPGPIALQVEYSLVARDVESEHVPAAREGGMGVMPWSPLAGGFLSGKYRREDTRNTGRLSGPNPFGDSKFTDRNWEVLETLKAVAAELDRPVAQVALSWVMARPGVTATIVGASKREQIVGAIAATQVVLSDAQMARLNAASAPPASFSAGLTSPMIRRMVFGGHAVTGWGE
ncbi:aldo/keto reductase [soil metagenome]